MKPSASWLAGLAEKIRRFAPNRRGNVALIAAFTMVPLLLAAGMGVDYTMAARRQDQITGYADAAALAAVTPTAMTGSSATAQTVALNNFEAQLATMSGVTYSDANISVVATDTVNGTVVSRVATVTWSASSNNAFASLLGLNTIAIGDSSKATSGVAPNTNFYLLVDTSPSMGIVATTAGINTLIANTQAQVDPQTGAKGCGFACHESDPAADGLGNPGGEDNYALARSLNLPLRIDLVNSATQSLMSTAATMAATNDTTYRAAIYTMDISVNQLMGLTTLTSGTVAAAQAAAANITMLEVCKNNYLSCGTNNNDEDSFLDTALNNVNTSGDTGYMPNPGNGTNNTGDTPQEVLMIVSDAVIDTNTTANPNGNFSNRVEDPINTYNMTSFVNNCNAIKARGIRIAFLYLTYNPLPTNGWYLNNVASFQSSIAPAAQACATGDLYYEVNTDGDVTGAMAALFQKAISEAHLLQ